MASVRKRTAAKGSGKGKATKWLISWYDAVALKWRTKAGSTDKALSLAEGQRLELESVARREGFTSSVRDEAVRPIDEQLAEFFTTVDANNPGEVYRKQLEQRVRRIIEAIGAKKLLDIEPGKVEAALLTMRTQRGFEGKGRLLSITTRNEYLSSITYFTRWAATRRKVEHDPLACLKPAEEKKQDRIHPRRALTVDEVARWLDATARRPVEELMMIRTGPKKGTLGAKVRPAVLEQARQKGIDRRMAYLTAVWTGLRRTELRLLEWRDLIFDATSPYIRLRGEVTKSGRDDLLPLHPQLTEELMAFRPASAKPTGRVLPVVPDMDVLKLDLKHAGIDYGNKEIGFADLHAQRKTLNMLMAREKADRRSRQAQLRHTDPRLTEDTYFDEALFVQPHAEELQKVSAIPVSKPLWPASGVVRAQLAHKTAGSTGHFESRHGTEDGPADDALTGGSTVENTKYQPIFGTERHDPASSDAGSEGKRVKGVEPSTFTLAT